jgi:hypothetical protein
MGVLWVLVILTSLAVSVGRGAQLNLSLARHAVGKSKTKLMAWAGVMHAIDQIRVDKEDAAGSRFDTLYQCGITLKDGNTPEDLFKNVALGGGYFDVVYADEYYGLRDEERLLNINTMTKASGRRILYGPGQAVSLQE